MPAFVINNCLYYMKKNMVFEDGDGNSLRGIYFFFTLILKVIKQAAITLYVTQKDLWTNLTFCI